MITPLELSSLKKFLKEPGLGLVLFTALRDSLVWLSAGIAGLFTIETILPGFVTLRFNLAIPIFFQAMLVLALAAVIKRFQIVPKVSSRLIQSLSILGALWLFIILFISLWGIFWPVKLLIILIMTIILWLLRKEYLS